MLSVIFCLLSLISYILFSTFCHCLVIVIVFVSSSIMNLLSFVSIFYLLLCSFIFYLLLPAFYISPFGFSELFYVYPLLAVFCLLKSIFFIIWSVFYLLYFASHFLSSNFKSMYSVCNLQYFSIFHCLHSVFSLSSSNFYFLSSSFKILSSTCCVLLSSFCLLFMSFSFCLFLSLCSISSCIIFRIQHWNK